MIMNGKLQFIKNLMVAFLAQGISLLISVFMSFVVPKFLGVTEYSYWQLFIFYSGYVGFFHFGLNDGIYLREGGKKYSELNFSLIGTQYWLSILLESVFSGFIILGAFFLLDNSNRRVILIVTAIYLLVSNATLFLGYIFQAVNETKLYSLSVIIDRVFVLISLCLLLILKVRVFEPFIYAYLLSKCIALLFCMIQGKKIVFAKFCGMKTALCEMWKNISVGIKLTIANIMSMLILGCGRIVIDNVWGVETFGKFSFSLSLTNFFLTFIAQVSMVLFPALRQVTEEKLKEIYTITRQALGVFMPVVFVLYVPISKLVGMWLPQYTESLRYLILLLPLCLFDGKMQLLCNTYFKVLRREKLLLNNNILAFVVSGVLSILGGYVFHNVYFIIISIVAAIMLRSIISEIYLSRILHVKAGKCLIQEVLMSVIFMSATWVLDAGISFAMMIAIYGVYLYANREELLPVLRRMKRRA